MGTIKQYRHIVGLARKALARGDCETALDHYATSQYRRGMLDDDRSMKHAWKLTTGTSLDLQKSIVRCIKKARK